MKTSQFLGIVSVTLFTFLAIALPGFSQDKRVEINPFFGYSFSDSVTVDPIAIGGQYSNQFEISGGLSLRS